MRVHLPLPDGLTAEPPESKTGTIVIGEQKITITNLDDTVPTERCGGLLYGVYELLSTQQVLSSKTLATIESQVGNGLLARLEYEDVDNQWTILTNPTFVPREPVDKENSPLSKGDMVPLGDTGFARFLGWRGEKTPTFALRSPGQPASRMGRLRLTDADSLFGTERETTVSQLLLCPKC